MSSFNQRLWTRDFILAITTLVGAQLIYFTLMAYMALYAVERFHVNNAAAGFAASSFVLGAGLGRLLTGKYLDFVGRKRSLLIALALSLVCSLIYPFIDHYGLLILVRIVQGSGFGISSTTIATAVISIIPVGRLSEGLGYVALAGTMSNAIGPLAAIQLNQHTSGLWVFLFTAVCALIALVMVVLMRVREREPSAAEHARKWRLRPGDLLDARALPVAIVALLASTGFALVMTYLTPYMVGLNLADAASLFFLVWAAAMLAVRLFAGRAHDRYGENAVIPAALIALATGLVVLAVADSLWQFIVAAILCGLGHGAAIPSLQAVGVSRTTRDRIAVATSTHYLALDTGIATGPVVLGVVVQLVGYEEMFLVGSAVVFLSVVVYWFLHGRTARRAA